MPSFSETSLNTLRITPQMLQTIRLLGEFKGRQDMFRLRAPEKLENLRQVALIESVESSNRIEGYVASPPRLRALVAGSAAPVDRPEAEIAGYRDVLATVHESRDAIPMTPQTVLQLHRDMSRYAPDPGGRWKSAPNVIEQTMPDGQRLVRFQPTLPHLTETAVARLHEDFADRLSRLVHEPLVLIALYVLDFLCIHPFADGNGRMSRLLTVLALYRQGYDVARYVSLERIVEETKDSYYETLHIASEGWHEDAHDPQPWIDYFLSVLLRAYRELDEGVAAQQTAQGGKTDLVIAAIDRMGDSFRIGDITDLCPSVSRGLIKGVLNDLKEQGALSTSGSGRGARWQRKAN